MDLPLPMPSISLGSYDHEIISRRLVVIGHRARVPALGHTGFGKSGRL
jgi:hypothetical protein